MSNELYHYGIKGQQWGRRLYQNKDGSLTAAGKKRYGTGEKEIQTGRFSGDYRNASDGKKGVQVTTITRTNPLLNGPAWRQVHKDQYVVEATPGMKRYTLKSVEKNRNETGDVVSYTGRNMNVSKETLDKLLDSSYDDLSDDELDTLHKLTGDDEIVEYRKKRTARIVSAGKTYARGSVFDNLTETVSAMITNSKTAALVRKGKEAAEDMVRKLGVWLAP